MIRDTYIRPICRSHIGLLDWARSPAPPAGTPKRRTELKTPPPPRTEPRPSCRPSRTDVSPVEYGSSTSPVPPTSTFPLRPSSTSGPVLSPKRVLCGKINPRSSDPSPRDKIGGNLEISDGPSAPVRLTYSGTLLPTSLRKTPGCPWYG